jgi:chromosome partitioning protein
MVIIVGGIKGGSGKSTVATNLCVMRAKERKDVLLVDADDQETATDFTLQRNERTGGKAGYTSIKLFGSAVRTEVSRLRPKYDDIIIDTGGRDTTSQRAALAVADILLVPFVPRSFDVWTLQKVGRVVDEMRQANPKLEAYAFLNRADPQGQDNGGAVDLLHESESVEYIDTPLGTRKAFGNAGGQGLGVCELSPPDPKALQEMTTLFERVFNVISTSMATVAVGGIAHGHQ